MWDRRWEDGGGEIQPEVDEIVGWPGKRSRSGDHKLPRARARRDDAHDNDAEPDSPAALVRALGTGAALDPRIADAATEVYGASLAAVRVHTGASAAAIASRQGARAFAIGEHVAFGAGEYQPGTPHGDALIAHELVHVVQQRHLGPAAVQRKRLVEDTAPDAAELEADDAARGLLARLYGGVKAAVKIVQLPARFSLQRCPGKASPPPPELSEPLMAKLYARLIATPPDIAGFYGDLAAQNGARANDAKIITGLKYAIAHGKLSLAQGFRAVAYLAFGPLTAWPLAVKNYADGVDGGTYTVAALPPGTPDALREFCVRDAGEHADGPGAADVKQAYRTELNARFDSSRFSALSSDFDPALDSKGPRSPRARAVFTELYNDVANPRFKTAYDSDTPPGFRELADTTLGPDGANLIASPRLQALRATLGPPPVVAPSAADPAYTALVAAVTPKAAALDARDRQELEREHSWRLASDGKVSGPSDAVTLELQDDLWRVITTSRAAGPAAPPPHVGPTAAPPPPPVPNPAQSAFLTSIHLAAPAAQNATTAAQPLTFAVTGTANPGLAVRRRVVVEPAAQVVEGQDNEQPWPNGATAVPHTAQIDPQPVAGAASTVFTARLTMPPLAAATFHEQTATVTVTDKRLDWFKATLDPGLTFVNFTDDTAIPSGGTGHYTGKQCPITVRPNLAGTPNPGLDIQIDGQLKRGGAVVNAIARAAFPRSAPDMSLFSTILQEPHPPPATPEAWELTLRVFQGTAAATVHTIVWPFHLSKTPAGGLAADRARMTSENAWLNTPIATAGHLLSHMNGKGGNYARVANAVAGGALKIRSCFVRSDSADQVTKLHGSPATDVAYAMGVVDALNVATNTLVAQPGAAGWRWGTHPDTVYLNTRPVPGGATRTLDELADFLAHEGIHAADRDSGVDADWDSYATEFRAYWVMGVGSAESTAFDPTMSGIGPKAPRARAVFNQVYGSATYPFVKPAYDANKNHFRERADNYLVPDGINLTLSPQLADLRRTIEAYQSGVTVYATTKATVTTQLAACPAGDKAEIHGNRMWRDLVEQQFTIPAERTEIKHILVIP